MIVLSVLAFVFALFSHPYTWGVVMASLFLYLLWTLFKHFSTKTETQRWTFTVIIVVLAANVLADIVKSQVAFSASGVAVASQIAASDLSLSNFLGFWQNLVFVLRYYVGGYFTQPLALFLTLVGTYVLARRGDPGSRILIAWLTVTALPLFFGTFTVQARTLYDLPLDVLSAIGLCGTLGVFYGKGSEKRKLLTLLFLAWVLLVHFNYVFRCMRNLLPLL